MAMTLSIVERLGKLAADLDKAAHDRWCLRKDLPVEGYSAEGRKVREAADTIEELVEALTDVLPWVEKRPHSAPLVKRAHALLAKLNGASCALADGPASDMRDGPRTPHGSLGS